MELCSSRTASRKHRQLSVHGSVLTLLSASFAGVPNFAQRTQQYLKEQVGTVEDKVCLDYISALATCDWPS